MAIVDIEEYTEKKNKEWFFSWHPVLHLVVGSHNAVVLVLQYIVNEGLYHTIATFKRCGVARDNVTISTC